MTGPEHLRAGKRLLSQVAQIGETSPAIGALATIATAHLAAAQVIAFAEANLPESISWQEAGNA